MSTCLHIVFPFFRSCSLSSTLIFISSHILTPRLLNKIPILATYAAWAKSTTLAIARSNRISDLRPYFVEAHSTSGMCACRRVLHAMSCGFKFIHKSPHCKYHPHLLANSPPPPFLLLLLLLLIPPILDILQRIPKRR